MRKKKDWPLWLERALQGLTYWTGHRRSLYRNYPLAEAAFVAELCNLIHANLPGGYNLYCEVNYTELIHLDCLVDPLTDRSRADLVVYRRIKKINGDVELHPKYVIEVKRASASNSKIDEDLRRLLCVKSVIPGIKAYLVVVSEGHRPSRFVSDSGVSIRKSRRINNSNGYFKVRRTLKAAYAYRNIEKSHYACLVEAYAGT